MRVSLLVVLGATASVLAESIDDDNQNDDWASKVFNKLQDLGPSYFSGTKTGHGKDLRQYNAGFDPSFGSDTKSNQMEYAKGRKTQTASTAFCPHKPTVPLNAGITCSTYSGCLMSCKKNYKLPNGKTQMLLVCLNNEWRPQDEGFDSIPACQPVCLPECQNNGICLEPNQCSCTTGFSGPQCQFQEKPCLSLPPLPRNSARRCSRESCSIQCHPGHQFPGGLKVTNILCQEGVWVPRNKEWQSVPDCEPICEPACQNGAQCMAHNRCQCAKDFRGTQCQFGKDRCDLKKLRFNGAINCTGNMESIWCTVACPEGVRISSTPASQYTCLYETGQFTPTEVPQCQYNAGTSLNKTLSHSTYYTKSSSGAKATSSNLVNPTAGNCLFWAGSHIKTFDGLLLSYKSDCAYTLLKDIKGSTFTVNVEKDMKLCANASACGFGLKIYIEDASFKFQPNGLGKVIMTSNENTIPIPVKMSELSVQLIGPLVVIKIPAFGVTLKWNTKLSMEVDITEHLWNRTGGLCSRMDGNAQNDLECRDGKQVSSVPVYLSNWESEFLGKYCNEPASTEHPCTASGLATEASNFCSKILNDPLFQPCHNVLDQQKYYEACRWDYCSSKSTYLPCETVAVFVNECKRKGVQLDSVWRSENFCGISCTGGSVYKQCGPESQATCLSAANGHQPAEFCAEGCYCPDGTVQLNGTCIQKEQCPCQYRGKLFPNGKTINQNCNTCICQGGLWTCTQVNCGARCSATGDPHYKTFDGKMFDFQGKCSYYLLKTDDLTIEGENIQCAGSISEALGYKSSSNPSCTKTITIKYDGSVIKLKQHRELVVNDKEISKLPIKVGNIRIRRVSSIFISVELNYDVLIWWDGSSQVYIDVPANYQGKTEGLCGTFNSNQKDDFLTPEGDIEQDVAAFANKWKVHDNCPNIEPAMESTPCETNPEKRAAAERLCGKLKNGNFTDCSWQVDSAPYYQMCLFDVCSCSNEPSTCFCPILAAYAHECASNGIPLNWRHEVRECGVQCPPGQVFQACGDSCSHSCTDISLNQKCVSKCVEGCNCPSGQTLDRNGDCIPVSECPCLSDGEEHPAYSKEVVHTADKSELCSCIKAQWICVPATAEDIRKNPKPPAALMNECDASKNLEFTKCEPQEPRSCKNLHVAQKKTPSICKPGCQCKTGFVLDSLSNTCVEPKKCPCHHGGRSYSEGETVQENCNVCKCQHGSWSCSLRICTGHCLAYGDPHFKTFDGRLYNFQGSCTYTLVQSRASPAESFEVVIQNVFCGSAGATCVKSVALNLAPTLDTPAEKVMLSNEKALPKVSSLNRTTVRDNGLHVIVEVFDLGLVVQWDKGTKVDVYLDPKWKNRVRGLCGNFNDNELDDFQTPSGGVTEISANVFGDSWKLQPQCPEAIDIKDHCALNPGRKAWAAEKCSILNEVFQPCHSEVPVEPYHEICMQDTCACDMGGDCDCLCTAISAYAQQCNANGVPIKWRSQKLCPMQCDEKCSRYSPCISSCPPETCENTLQLKSLTQLCSEGVCIEGCQLEKCPEGQIYSSMQDLKCVPRSSCKPVCMEVGNKTYYEGDLVKQDACHTCHCSHHKVVCQGVPCPPKTTTEIPTTFPTIPAQDTACVSGWSSWTSHKSPPKDFGDYQPLDEPQKIGLTCGLDHMSDIKCRTVGTHVDFRNTKENVICDLEHGLICNGTAAKPCSKYEIQVLCDCHGTYTTTEQTRQLTWCEDGWTQWFNNSHPEDDHGDYEDINEIRASGAKICSEEQVKRIQCKYVDPDSIEKAKGVKGANKKGLRDFKESNQIVTCKKKQGLYCNNLQQLDSICHDYAIRVECQCDVIATSSPPPEVTTQSLCPPGYEWRECLYECDALCHSFEAVIRAEGFCSNITDCKPGCAKVGEVCAFGQSWRSENECVLTEDCTCLAYDGSLVQPGGVVSENNNCTKCQCINNNFKCKNKENCLSNDNQIVESTTLRVSTTVSKEDFIFSTTTEADDQCDVWSSWFNDHNPTDEPFEREGKSTLELFDLGFCTNDHVEKIECVSTKDGTSSKNALNVRCNLQSGLTCYDDEQGLLGKCLDYKVRYYCSCEEIATESTTVGLLTTSTTRASTTTTPILITVATTVRSTVTPPHKCDPDKFVPLIQGDRPLQDSALSASSSMSRNSPKKARIVPGARTQNTWIADEDDNQQYLQISFAQPEPIFGVLIRGNPATDQFVTSYKIFFSNDGFTFSEATDAYGVPTIFRGPIDSRSESKEILPVPFEAKYVRINPQTWTSGVALQVEVFGCAKNGFATTENVRIEEKAVCDGEMGMRDERLQERQISVSSVLNGDVENYGPKFARLGSSSVWKPNGNTQKEWIMVDFLGPRELTGISIQGDKKTNTWVTAFYVQYSQDGHQWNKILTQTNNEKVFLGNVDGTNVMRSNFDTVLMAQYLKIIPIKWNKGISLKMEIFGCYEPYPTMAIIEEPPTTTPVPGECKFCQNLPHEKKTNCFACTDDLLWNGEGCVPQSDCSCYVGHLEYPVGSVYEQQDCHKCTCALGGVPQCQMKQCPACKDPTHQSVMTPTCSCVCKPCPDGSVICPTSKVCILKEQWCDGIEHCSDDEKNCTKTTSTPRIPVMVIPTCPPEPKCVNDFVLKKTTVKSVGPTKNKKQLLRCPIYECVAPPKDHFCSIEGKTIVTFDNTTLEAHICDHILAQEPEQWSITATKSCSGEMGVCKTYVTIAQQKQTIKLNPDFTVEFNNFTFDIPQAQTIAARYREFEISNVGDQMVFESNHFGFKVVYYEHGDIQIFVPNKFNGKVNGLCGLMNGDSYDDKSKPDGTLTQSSVDFVNSWTVPDSDVKCLEYTCPLDNQEAAYKICMDIKQKGNSLKGCHSVVQWDHFLTTCIEKTCECLKEEREVTCKCKAATNYVTRCNLMNPPNLDLSHWRVELGCAIDCPPGLIHHDCFRHKCEPSCANLSSCPLDKNICTSGCFCAEGLVRNKDKMCIKPEECKDCICDGFGDPQYLTFDRLNYTFNGNCSYIASRDVSQNGEHQFEIMVTNIECVDEPGTTCTEGVTVLHQGHVISMKRLEGQEKKILTTLDGVLVDKFPVQNDWMSMEAVPKQRVVLFLKNVHIQVAYMYNNYAFNIRLPSHTFGNKTEGLCGNCNKDTSDDMKTSDGMMSDSVDDFGSSWLVKNLPKGILFEDNCKVNKVPECMPLPPDEDPCLWIMDEDKFGKCHQLVDPLSYIQACQFDVCHSKNRQATACRDVEAYARDCQRHGLCFDWRSDGLCPYQCSTGFEYQPCGSGCQQNCDNVGQKCQFEDTEGCFCPEGQVVKNGKCVPKSQCKPCDSDNHFLGDVWQTDKCTTCKCEENGGQNSTTVMKCMAQTCNPLVCKVNEFTEVVPGTENDCCPTEVCKEITKTDSCKLESPPQCGLNQELKNLADEFDCPQYVCQCIPKDKCPPVEEMKEFLFLEEGAPKAGSEPGMVRTINESGCCPHVTYKCDQTKCPVTNCRKFFDITVVKGTENNCCPIKQCTPPNDKCIFEANFVAKEQGGERALLQSERTEKIHMLNTTWLESPCRRCACSLDAYGTPMVNCAFKSCPESRLDEEYKTSMKWIPGKCCPEHVREACKVGDKIYKEGEKWSPEDEPCKVVECRKEAGTLEKVINLIECNSTCNLGWLYKKPESGQCCGKCEQVACVLDGVLHQAGEKWQSEDKCTTTSCEKVGDQLQIASFGAVCQSVEGCPTEQLRSAAGGCCQICEPPTGNQVDEHSCLARNTTGVEEATVAMITEMNQAHGKCFNTKPIKGFKECSGSCESRTRYNQYDAMVQISDCKCCQGVEYELIEVEVTCEDGFRYKKEIRVPSECTCSQCSAAAPTNSRKGPTKGKAPKFLSDIPAQ